MKKNILTEEVILEKFINMVNWIQGKYPEYKKDIDFADLIGVAKQSLSNYKNKQRKPSIKVLCSIKNIFPEINMNYLIGNDDNILMSESEEMISLQEKIKDLESKIEVLKEIAQNK